MASVSETRRGPIEPGYWLPILLALGAVALGIAGYRIGFLGFVYGLMVPDAFSRVDTFALAAVMGVAAFFSPCAFPLLPGYMTYQLEAVQGEARLARSLWLGLLAALGVVIVNVVVGVAIASLGAGAPFNADPREDPWVVLAPRLLGGLFVTYLGAVYLSGGSLSWGPLGRLGALVTPGGPPAQRPALSTFLYGALYNLIGIGCTGALMLALVLYTLTAGSFWTALGAFVIFSATMGALMVGVTALAGVSPQIIRPLRGSIADIRRVAGAFMLAAGALTVAFVLQGNDLFTRIFFPFFS